MSKEGRDVLTESEESQKVHAPVLTFVWQKGISEISFKYRRTSTQSSLLITQQLTRPCTIRSDSAHGYIENEHEERGGKDTVRRSIMIGAVRVYSDLSFLPINLLQIASARA